MAHTCGCNAGCKANASSITADRTVEDVSHQSPGALAILKAKGYQSLLRCPSHAARGGGRGGHAAGDLLEALAILEGNPA
jgi:hypothetical protein